MKDEINLSRKMLADAINRLKEGVESSKDELDKDGVIQRFEFTFELLSKTLKIYLENEGIKCVTPKECLKAAFKTSIIEDEEIYLKMLNDRNISSHLYSKEESEDIFKRIKDQYLAALLKVSKILTEK